MKHLHHIIPKHVGGTDDPSNLVELTVEQHAKAHYLLWNQYGRWQDRVAWKALSKLIGKEEIVASVQSEASKEAWRNENYREAITKVLCNHRPKAVLASQTEVARQKQKNSFKKISHQQGPKNSQYGTMWITNETHSYRIDKTDSIPIGYRKGRTCPRRH